jgi:hypothetical protein
MPRLSVWRLMLFGALAAYVANTLRDAGDLRVRGACVIASARVRTC